MQSCQVRHEKAKTRLQLALDCRTIMADLRDQPNSNPILDMGQDDIEVALKKVISKIY